MIVPLTVTVKAELAADGFTVGRKGDEHRADLVAAVVLVGTRHTGDGYCQIAAADLPAALCHGDGYGLGYRAEFL